MNRFLKSTFLWQFAGGFVIGALGLFAFNPVAASIPAATETPAQITTR